MTGSPVQRTGALPVYQASVDFQSAEYIYAGTALTPRAAILALAVPPVMAKRSFYFYVAWTNNGNANSGIFFDVELFLNLTSVGKLPFQQIFTTNTSLISRSAMSLSNGIVTPTSGMMNNLAVTFAGPIAKETQSGIWLSPFSFQAAVNEIKLNYVRAVNVLKINRIIIACLSSL
jgi:hypothetical protein